MRIYYCPACKHLVKRDGRQRDHKGKTLKSFCESTGSHVRMRLMDRRVSFRRRCQGDILRKGCKNYMDVRDPNDTNFCPVCANYKRRGNDCARRTTKKPWFYNVKVPMVWGFHKCVVVGCLRRSEGCYLSIAPHQIWPGEYSFCHLHRDLFKGPMLKGVLVRNPAPSVIKREAGFGANHIWVRRARLPMPPRRIQ